MSGPKSTPRSRLAAPVFVEKGESHSEESEEVAVVEEGGEAAEGDEAGEVGREVHAEP